VIVLLGAFVGPAIRAMTPRAAMLGTLAGISIAFISMRPAFQMWELPWIGLVCFAIVLIAWTANIRLPGGIPGGLLAVIVGTIIGWVASFAGWSDYMQPGNVAKSVEHLGLRIPLFSMDVWRGLADVAPLLVTAIPLGIYNFTEAMNNVESASAAGDNYSLRTLLLADGLGAIVARGHPIVLAGDGDVGGLIGIHLRQEMKLGSPIVSIDGLELKECDFIDIGAMLESSGAVPVVIKSLIFPASAGGGRDWHAQTRPHSAFAPAEPSR